MTIEAVLIPGTLCDARIFDGVVARLPGWRTAVPDLTRYARVEEAAEAILAVSPERFVGVGFSLGGFVALEMLRRAPERLLGVVLVSGNAHPDRPENAAKRRTDVERSRRIGMEAYVRESGAAWGVADDPNIIPLLTDMAAALGPEVHARQAEMNIARPDLRETARNTRVPMLVIAGGRDPLCTAERYADAAGAPGAELLTLPEAGHFLPLEAPGEIAHAIARLRMAA